MAVAPLEEPIVFSCKADRLIGVLHRPSDPKSIGVIVVTGAPQYRIGSHRQYVLLGRRLAEAGFPVLRFDYRGMGDSEGEFVGFEGVDDDIHAAIDCLFAEVGGLRHVALWGLCDGASAAAFYAGRDERVGGLILVNPWVRTQATTAQARVKHYYRSQLTSRDFWRRLTRREVRLVHGITSFWQSLRVAFQSSRATEPCEDLPARVAASLRLYKGPVLLILSGADLTAQEFDAAVLQSSPMKVWKENPAVTVHRLESANHTYSRQLWRDQVHKWTEEWLKDLS